MTKEWELLKVALEGMVTEWQSRTSHERHRPRGGVVLHVAGSVSVRDVWPSHISLSKEASKAAIGCVAGGHSDVMDSPSAQAENSSAATAEGENEA